MKIEQELTPEEESKLLEHQVRGLFFSTPVSIEEKGNLLKLMHQLPMRDVLVDIISEIN